MATKTEFVTRYDSIPCPVCGGNTKGCSLLDDGGQMCRGEPLDNSAWKIVAETGQDGFRLYRSAESAKRRKAKAPPPTNWSAKAVHYASKLDRATREALALTLGLPTEALALVPLVGTSGATTAGIIGTFPESDPDGITIGIMERDPSRDPKHKMMPGGSRGLILAAGWDAPPGPVLVVEGATDTLACAAAGLCVVGRPGAEGKVELLVELLRKLPADRPVIVVGENDRKADGKWPGKEAAEKVAAMLIAAGLPNPVSWSLPPEAHKDSRAVLVAGVGPWCDRGQAYLAHLTTAAVSAVSAAEAIIAARPAPPDDTCTDPDPAKWSADPDNPHRLARAFLATLSPADALLRLRYWREEFHEWRDGCYHTLRDGDLRARLGGWLETEFKRVYALELAAWKAKADQGGKVPKERPVRTGLVNDMLHALRSLVPVPADTRAPTWIDGSGPPAAEIVACRNGLVHLTTGELSPPTAGFFSFTVSPYDYDPASPAPVAWLTFLSQIWPDDRASIECLQEWFGYLLTGDNSQQKMLFLLGVSRGGKSTVANVLTHLVGQRNVFGTSYSTLANDFGLWPLVDKSIALMGDGRTSGREELDRDAIEKILKITGGDPVGINRKGMPFVSAVLDTRFVCVSNELPRLYDNSGAMVGRMILLHFARSFRGAEDTGLLPRLLTDLPGILLWAIEGLQRLRRRGRFVQPRTGEEQLNVLRDASSPISSFLRDTCRVTESGRVTKKKLYGIWSEWCKDNGRREPGSLEQFSIKLLSLGVGVTVGRERIDGQREQVYRGVRPLEYHEEPEDNGQSDEPSGDDAASVQGCPGVGPVCPGGGLDTESSTNPSTLTPISTTVQGVQGCSSETCGNESQCAHDASCATHGELTPPPGHPGHPGQRPITICTSILT
jgi:putative DNA primase/helicase